MRIRNFLLVFISIFPALCHSAGKRPVSSQTVTYQSANLQVFDFASIDYQPNFPGGEQAMLNYINAERRYPAQAYSQGVEGKVILGIVVDPNGAISHVTVVRSVEQTLDNEAVRIVTNMPNWEPGQRNGQNVAVYCLIPVQFRR